MPDMRGGSTRQRVGGWVLEHSVGVFTALIALCAILPFLQTIPYPFVWDDSVFVNNNPAVTEIRGVSTYFTDPQTQSSHPDYNHEIYRPLRTLLFAVTMNIFGPHPEAFRLLNIFLHMGCALLLFSIGRRLSGVYAGFAAGLIFAVHPAHAEAVTWISSLADPLSTIFYLSALRGFLSDKAAVRGIAVSLLFPLALFSKEMAITFPAVLALSFVFRDNRKPIAAREAACWIIGSGAVSIVYFLWRWHVVGAAAQSPLSGGVFLSALARTHLVLFEYLRMLTIPYPLCSLRTTIVPALLPWTSHALAAGVLILLCASLFRLGKAFPRMPWFAVAFFVSLSPVLGFLPVTIHVAERFAYLPSAWFCLLLAEWLVALRNRMTRPWIADSLLGATAVIFAMTLSLTNTTWRSGMSVFLAQASCESPDPTAYWNLGTEAQQNRQWETALEAYRIHMLCDNPFPMTLNNMSYVCLQMRRWDEAADCARRRIALSPDDMMALGNLGAAYLGKGDNRSAAEVYRIIADRWPDQYLGHFHLAVALALLGEREAAIPHFKKAQALKPAAPEPRMWLENLERKLPLPPSASASKEAGGPME